MERIAFASIAGLATLLATAFPNWIELTSRWDPDGRNGSVELFVAAGVLTLAALTFALTAVKRIRLRSRFSNHADWR